MSHVASDMQRQSPGATEAAAKLSRLMSQRVTTRSQEQALRFFLCLLDGLR